MTGRGARRLAAAHQPGHFFTLYMYLYIVQVLACKFSKTLTGKKTELFSFENLVQCFCGRLYLTLILSQFTGDGIVEATMFISASYKQGLRQIDLGQAKASEHIILIFTTKYEFCLQIDKNQERTYLLYRSFIINTEIHACTVCSSYNFLFL